MKYMILKSSSGGIGRIKYKPKVNAKHGTDWTGRVLFIGCSQIYVLFELLDYSLDL